VACCAEFALLDPEGKGVVPFGETGHCDADCFVPVETNIHTHQCQLPSLCRCHAAAIAVGALFTFGSGGAHTFNSMLGDVLQHVVWLQMLVVPNRSISLPDLKCQRLQVERLLKQIDLNSDDGIAYDEWMAAMLTWRTVRGHNAPHSICAV
jgi:hypothetical protein